MSVRKGVFHVIATPIGNLSDITPRARDVMAGVDILYAEDTRHTTRLCSHLGINPKLRSLHDHNEAGRVSEVIDSLRSGLAVGLVSDAGTPLISDPGYRIVAACHEAGLQVSPIPGVSAVTSVLSVCGLPTDRFLFSGFLPAKASARRKSLDELKTVTATLVLFESKHRIVEALADMQMVLGDRQICVAREVTKAFESIMHGSVSEVLQLVAGNTDSQKGEFVVVINGAAEAVALLDTNTQKLLLDIASHTAPKQAAKIVARHSGVPARTLYEWLLAQKQVDP